MPLHNVLTFKQYRNFFLQNVSLCSIIIMVFYHEKLTNHIVIIVCIRSKSYTFLIKPVHINYRADFEPAQASCTVYVHTI